MLECVLNQQNVTKICLNNQIIAYAGSRALTSCENQNEARALIAYAGVRALPVRNNQVITYAVARALTFYDNENEARSLIAYAGSRALTFCENYGSDVISCENLCNLL